MRNLVKIVAAVVIATAAFLPARADEIARADGVIQLQFLRWSTENRTTVGVLAAVRNTTDTDIAAMTWSCDLTNHGQLVGRGVPVTFAIVPKNTVAVGTVFLYANGGMFNGGDCHLVAKEDMTAQNARLYYFGPDRLNEPADQSHYWRPTKPTAGTFTATPATAKDVTHNDVIKGLVNLSYYINNCSDHPLLKAEKTRHVITIFNAAPTLMNEVLIEYDRFVKASKGYEGSTCNMQELTFRKEGWLLD